MLRSRDMQAVLYINIGLMKASEKTRLSLSASHFPLECTCSSSYQLSTWLSSFLRCARQRESKWKDCWFIYLHPRKIPSISCSRTKVEKKHLKGWIFSQCLHFLPWSLTHLCSSMIFRKRSGLWVYWMHNLEVVSWKYWARQRSVECLRLDSNNGDVVMYVERLGKVYWKLKKTEPNWNLAKNCKKQTVLDTQHYDPSPTRQQVIFPLGETHAN